jgi:hypothetical protein
MVRNTKYQTARSPRGGAAGVRAVATGKSVGGGDDVACVDACSFSWFETAQVRLLTMRETSS